MRSQQEITSGGAESVLECVGSESAMAKAIGIARPGRAIGYVGVPHGSRHNFNLERLFMNNITLQADLQPPVLTFGELLADMVAGKLNASAVLDLTVNLDGVPRGYVAMDGREAIARHGTTLKNLAYLIQRRVD